MSIRSSVALIFIGVLGIYVAIFGLAAPPGFSLNLGGNLMVKQDWDSLSPWVKPSGLGGQVDINPAGYLHLLPGAGSGSSAFVQYNDWSRGQLQYTIEFTAKADKWVDGAFSIQTYSGTKATAVNFFQNQADSSSAGAVNYANSLDTGSHVYTVVYDLSAPTIDAYIDEAKVGSWANVISYTTTGPMIIFGMWNNVNSGSEAHVDYIYVVDGLHPPAGGLTTGYTLTTSVVGQGSISVNPSGTSYSAGTLVTLTAVPNNGYSFVSWSGDTSGTSLTISVTMNSNKTVTATFTGNTSPSPGPQNETLLDKINKFLANSTVRGLDALISIVFLGFGVIDLLPSKPHAPSAHSA